MNTAAASARPLAVALRSSSARAAAGDSTAARITTPRAADTNRRFTTASPPSSCAEVRPGEVGLLLADRRGGPRKGYAAAFQDVRAVAYGERDRRVLLDDQKRGARRTESVEDRENVGNDDRRETVRRLVEHQQPG